MASYSQTLEGTNKAFLINHGLNTDDVIVQIYDLEHGENQFFDIERVDENNVRISSGDNVEGGKYRVVIIS